MFLLEYMYVFSRLFAWSFVFHGCFKVFSHFFIILSGHLPYWTAGIFLSMLNLHIVQVESLKGREAAPNGTT